MGLGSERTASEWFRAAMESYVAEHQGCPCCKGRHCVFRSFWGKRIEYFCSTCEFSVCLDGLNGQYYASAGDKQLGPGFVLDSEVDSLGHCPSTP